MFKNRLNLRKLVAIAICLAGAATMLAQETGVVINGVKWATRNVDKPGIFATNPEDAGMFYQWNRKVGWSATNPMINSEGGTTWDNTDPDGTTWEKSNDPSPTGWRVPTVEEIRALCDRDKVDNEWTIINGVPGRKFTDKASGNSIFLPAAGCRDNYALYYTGSNGRYWSSTKYNREANFVNYMAFSNSIEARSWGDVNKGGQSVRCVAE